jgi:predicted nuclease of restriction endonuclease-like (RecB) superfamily
MKKKGAVAKQAAQSARNRSYTQLVSAISAVNTQMVGRVATVANQALVLRNWIVGAYIVEFEQEGADRAKYGARLLPRLAADLRGIGVNGLGVETLRTCRSFFLVYPEISQAALGKLGAQLSGGAMPQPLVGALAVKDANDNQVPGSLPTPLKPEELVRISWAHFLELIRLDDPWKRAFYENEIIKGHWSQRQLQRQIESLLYERTGLSSDKKAVVERARKQEPQESIAEMLRDPYILEFTGLAELAEYSENDLETALLDHLQRFLLELGRGFCFEARQFRMTEGRKHHRVDLVFYHRLLRCHVLIDLKVRAFQPADAGQMNFYVNWFKANMRAEGDNPPVGILLCSDKDSAEVEFATAGMDQKLFVTRYLSALPSAEQLKSFLERDREQFKALIRQKDHSRGLRHGCSLTRPAVLRQS